MIDFYLVILYLFLFVLFVTIFFMEKHKPFIAIILCFVGLVALNSYPKTGEDIIYSDKVMLSFIRLDNQMLFLNLKKENRLNKEYSL